MRPEACEFGGGKPTPDAVTPCLDRAHVAPGDFRISASAISRAAICIFIAACPAATCRKGESVHVTLERAQAFVFDRSPYPRRPSLGCLDETADAL
jgi:hypothetical protein